MNVFSIGIILLLIMFGIVGAKRGIIKEGAALLGVVITFIISFMLKTPIGNLLCKILPVISFGKDLEGLSALSILAYHLIAFLVIFVIVLSIIGLVMKLSKYIQKLVNMTIVLIIPSAIGGFIIGMLSGYLILFIVLINLNIFLNDSDIYRESKVANYITNKTPLLSDTCKNYQTTVLDIYSLANNISEETISNTEANSIAIDKMLSNKIVSKGLIIDLIESNKIENSAYLTKVLNKY